LLEVTEDAMDVLKTYDWPCNLTELHQVVTKIAATAETRVVTSQELPMRLKEVKKWPSLADYLAGQQKQYVDMVVHACADDKAKAAKVLGIDVSKIK
jgi:two-component system, NtrC family, response regulator HydG